VTKWVNFDLQSSLIKTLLTVQLVTHQLNQISSGNISIAGYAENSRKKYEKKYIYIHRNSFCLGKINALEHSVKNAMRYNHICIHNVHIHIPVNIIR